MKPTPKPTVDRARVVAMLREALAAGESGSAAERELDTAGALLLTPDPRRLRA
jgi:hypothetical protein